MTMSYHVAVVVGSLRKGSINRIVARSLIECAPSELKFSLVEIGDLALYNPDKDDKPPTAWTSFRTEIYTNDALLFVTPEYNRSVPGH